MSAIGLILVLFLKKKIGQCQIVIAANSVKLVGQGQCPDWAIFCTLGNHSKPVARIILPKLHTLLCDFCKGVKIIHFSSEIIVGQVLSTFGNFYLAALAKVHSELELYNLIGLK